MPLSRLPLVLALLAATAAAQERVPRWTRFETHWTAQQPHANPVQDVQAEVEFTSPSARTHRVLAFWDGDATWRVRFSPNEVGRWTYRTVSSPADPGLHAQSGSFTAVEYAGDNPLYRHGAVGVSDNRHHFTHADGTPFLWLGDTVWNGVLLADARDWDVFLADRRAKGFNVIQYVTTRWSTAFADAAGRVPFSGRERIALDPIFFRRMDERVDAINRHGLLAAPVLLWAHPSQPELNPGVALPDGQAILLARYLVARYGAHQVAWLLNGDGNYLGGNAERWKRLGRAVFATAHPDRLATLHPGRKTWMTDDYAAEPWFRFNGYQSGHRDDDEHLRWLTTGPPSASWRRTPPVPDVNLEPNYEAHRSRVAGATHVFDAHAIRRAAYWSLLVAPPAGVTYGAHGIWSWETRPAEPLHHAGTGLAPPWPEAMRLPGSVSMKHLKALFDGLPWWTLRPAQDALAAQPGEPDRRRFIAASRSEDGATLLAYLPVGGPVRFRPEAVAGVRQARWFDPRMGQWRAAQTATEYTAPDGGDWVLCLTR